ncbi:uncharacterized protein [Haliotis cracherodii]|uniref:uncharacterized protein n=1 Tax=Haliotis cracherodii TaxID=6455 RepID=UPI0039EC7F0E
MANVKDYLWQLLEKACEHGHGGVSEIVRDVYRNKPSAYFDDIQNNKDNLMEKYLKDEGGDPRCPINGRLKGLFFGVTLRNGALPRSSPFGDTRVMLPLSSVFYESTNLYFADFFCMPTGANTHYVILVITKDGSESDRFCKQELLELDPYDNMFLFRQRGIYKALSRQGLWLEVFYTEDVDISGLSLTPTAVLGQGHSSGGIGKDPSCRVCNVEPDTRPQQRLHPRWSDTDVEVDGSWTQRSYQGAYCWQRGYQGANFWQRGYQGGFSRSKFLTGVIKEQIAGRWVIKEQIAGRGVIKEQLAGRGVIKQQIAGRGVIKEQIAGRGDGGSNQREMGYGGSNQMEVDDEGSNQREIGYWGSKQREMGYGGSNQREMVYGGSNRREMGCGGSNQREMGYGGSNQREMGCGGSIQREMGHRGSNQREIRYGGSNQREMGYGGSNQREMGCGGSIQREMGHRGSNQREIRYGGSNHKGDG